MFGFLAERRPVQFLGLPYTVLVAVAVDLIGKIKEQSGMTTEEIIERAGLTLDENQRMLIEDLERLKEPK